MGWKEDPIVQSTWQSDPVVKPAPEAADFTDRTPKAGLNPQGEPGLQDVTLDDASTLAAVPGLARAGGQLAIKGLAKVLPEAAPRYLDKWATEAAIKQAEGSFGQIRQLGKDKVKEIADYMYRTGLMKPTMGSVGMEDAVKASEKTVGEGIGALRNKATEAGVRHNADDIVKGAEAELGPTFASGARADEAATFKNSLDEVRKLGSSATPEEVSKTVTALNRDAAGKSLMLPQGSKTDVARYLRNLNDKAINGVLSPAEQAQYAALKKEYGTIEPLIAMIERGDLKGMSSKAHGGTLTSIYNKIADVAGHKLAGTAFNAGAKALTNPATMGDIAGGLSTPNMAYQLAKYLREKYGGPNAE